MLGSDKLTALGLFSIFLDPLIHAIEAARYSTLIWLSATGLRSGGVDVFMPSNSSDIDKYGSNSSSCTEAPQWGHSDER